MLTPIETRTIVIIEDDPVMGESITQRLVLEGYRCHWWRTGRDALTDLCEPSLADAIICDIRLPDIDGEELFQRLQTRVVTRPILFMTAFGDIEQAVRLVRAGASDYMVKPFAMDHLLKKLSSVLAGLNRNSYSRGVLGRSGVMLRLEGLLRRIKDIETSVLLIGESGAGKEIAAQFLHNVSKRHDLPFTAVNCAAIVPELMDSELFGHEKGSFTGAHALHVGFAERASTGTLFLDEVAELPLGLQAKLLRLLQDRMFYRVGGERQLTFAARLISATNADLRTRVEQGSFRKDLYYRLNVIELEVPPLRERPEDTLDLVRTFVSGYGEQFSKRITGITSCAEQAILQHEWPGNIRELKNRAERAVAVSERILLDVEDFFPEAASRRESHTASLVKARARAEHQQIVSALDQAGWRIGLTAKKLGVSRTTLWEKMKRLGIRQSNTRAECE